MDSLKGFRNEVLNNHLLCELRMEGFITSFFFDFKSGATCFHTHFKYLILDNLSFSKKISIILNIFKKKVHYQRILNFYPDCQIKNNKIISIANGRGEIFMIGEVIKSLKKINDIRNHLFHNIVCSPKILEKCEIFIQDSSVNMNFKGDLEELNEAYIFVDDFFRIF